MIDPVPQIPINEENTPWWKRWFNNLVEKVLTSDSSIRDLSDVEDAAPTNGHILTWNDSNSQWEGQAAGAGSEVNDLTLSVTWANVPDVNITQSSVTQHQAALSITESQISDLQSYVAATGTPVNNQIAVWTAADTIEGDANLTWNGSTLLVDDTQILSGNMLLTGTTSSGITLVESGATTDNKNWGIGVQSSNLTLGVISDDFLSNESSITINRNGVTTDSIELAAPVQIESNLDFVSSATSIDLVSGTLEYTVNSTLTARMRDTEFNVLGDTLTVGVNDSNDGRLLLYGDNLTQGGRIYMYNGGSADSPVNRFELEATAGSLDFLQDSTAIAELHDNGSFFMRRDLVIDEAADHAETPTAGKGQFWVRDDAPCVPMFTDDTGTDYVLNSFGGSEVNDLTASVTWANIPDANVPQTAVTQHQTALTITESQISDLGSYLTNNQTITLSGDITGSGNTSITTTIANDAVDIAMLSATGTPSSSTYLRGDNTWASIAGGGDVTKVGTPANNQVGVWTGDGTLEGDANLTWSGSTLTVDDTEILSGSISLTGTSSSGLVLIQSGATTNNKNWAFSVQSENFSIGVISDDYLSNDAALTINRSGVSTSSIELNAPVDITTGALSIVNDLVIDESADHSETPTAGKGQFWVRNDTPCVPVFTDDAGTDHVLNSSGGTYAIWKAKGNLSSASFDDTENVLPWNNWAIDGGSDVTLSGTPQSDITINTTGTYKFTVTLRTDSGNRTELFIRTYIDTTGAGYIQDTDEIVSDYVSRDADQDTGSVTLSTALALDANDKIEFRGFGDTDGTCVGLDAGTILIIERVA